MMYGGHYARVGKTNLLAAMAFDPSDSTMDT